MQIGKFKHRIEVSSEFLRLAKEDEEAASALMETGRYRQAVYFIVQAMEKYVKGAIFTLVNPNLEYFRERNRSHSLEDAVDLLVEILSRNDATIKLHVKKQLLQFVLGDTQYNRLHNDVRYPFYFRKYDSYSVLEISKEDGTVLVNRLASLKNFLKEMHRFN